MTLLLFTTIITVLLLSLTLISSAFADTITLTGTIRDFNGGPGHPDFEDGIAFDPGIVLTMLGVDKKPVYAGLAGNPTTHGQAAFDQWYRDVTGVNLAVPLSITLSNTPATPSIYTFSDTTFFPIDDQLLGNQGRSHNYHFTYEIHSQFTYQGGEVFTFTGDDDLWVFINNKLVIDLGGVHPAMTASVSLDTLGLTLGQTYDFDLFFAERHTVASTFRIGTTIQLEPQNQPPTCSDVPMTTLWPPNHRMVPVDITIPASDADGDILTLSVISILQDESTNGLGDGDTSPDATLSPVEVRAERSGTGDGRVYVITVEASDGNGGSCTGTVEVGVPHSVNTIPVNSGATYDSTTS